MKAQEYVALAGTQAGLWQVTAAALTYHLACLRDGRLPLVVVAAEHPFRSTPGLHFHPRPELLIQLAGVSSLRLPESQVLTRAGRVLLTPRGVPHHETNGSASQPFCNLIFMYEEAGFTFHSALADPGHGQLQVVQRAFVPYKAGSRLYGYLNEIGGYLEKGLSVRHPVVQGLMLTHLGLLRDAVGHDDRPAPLYSPLVAQARQLALQNLGNSDLSVKWLAHSINCSADYLSHRFHVETGETLIGYVNQERRLLAEHLLQHTTMNVAEIAQSCGYRDPSYFTRVFTKQTGHSPRSFRRAMSAG